MDLLPNIFIILLAGFLHASLQLGPGCLLLLCRHTLGTPKLRRTTPALVSTFILGSVTITILALSAFCYLFFTIFQNTHPPILFTAITAGIAVGLAFILPFVYYRRATGTTLWIPRTTANFLNSRSEKTTNPAESFSLGLMTVLGEAPLTLILISIASYAILELTTSWQLLMIAAYTIIAATPLIFTSLSLRFGSNISRTQRWRETNKPFIKFILVAGFFTLGAYIFAFKGFPAI